MADDVVTRDLWDVPDAQARLEAAEAAVWAARAATTAALLAEATAETDERVARRWLNICRRNTTQEGTNP